jgi:glycosyltransferase involved in cell wall biosynthesis
MHRAIRAFQPDVTILSDHGAPGLFLRKQPGEKVILVSHHNPARFLDPPAPPDFSSLDAGWALHLEQRVLEKVDAVVCPSRYMADCFAHAYRFSGPVRVIPNLVDQRALQDVQPRDIHPELNLPANAPLIYFPSAGSYLKGAEFALAIIHQLAAGASQPFGIYLPGLVAPRFAADFDALAASVPIYRPGHLPYDEHLRVVAGCSFGISPSLMENYSMAILEALLLGLPVLAFDTGGNADLIRSGQNGYLFPFPDANALGAQAAELLDAETLAALRKRTSVYSGEQLDPEEAAQAYVDLLESL